MYRGPLQFKKEMPNFTNLMDMLHTAWFNLRCQWKHAVLMSRANWKRLSKEEAAQLEARMVFARVIKRAIV